MRSMNLTHGPIVKSMLLFSAAYGAGDEERMHQDIGLSFWFIGGITVLLYLICIRSRDRRTEMN